MNEQEVFNAIAELVADRLDIDQSEVTMGSDFKELGIDSLDTIELLMDLEDKIGTKVELKGKVATVGELVAHILAA